MKHLSLLAFLLAATLTAWSGTIYQEDFESYSAGTELVGTVDGWNFFSTYSGTSTIVENESGMAGKSLKMAQKAGGSADYDMIFTPKFDMHTEDAIREMVRISATVIPSSDTDIMALYAVGGQTNRFAYLHCSVGSGTLSSYPSGATLSNLHKDATPNQISILWDNYDNTIAEITCNGQTQACHIAMSGDFYKQPVRLRLSTQFSSNKGWATYYDNLKVETEYRYSTPHIYCAEDSVALKKTSQKHLTIFNCGPEGTINFEVKKSSDASWLAVSPSSGSFADSKELTFSGSGAADYKRTVITIDCGTAGSKDILVTWQNGTTFYFEDFEAPAIVKGELQNQGGWLEWGPNCNDSNKAMIEDKDSSQVMHAYRAIGYDGIRRGGEATSPSIEGCPPQAIVKISCRIYWDSSSNSHQIYLATPAGAKPFSLKIKKSGDGKSFYLYQMQDGGFTPPLSGVTWPMDQWVNFAYTLDFQSQKGVSIQFNDDIGDTSAMNLYGDGKFQSLTGLSFCTDKETGGDDWDAKFYFDDIKCETLPRGDEPILGLTDTVIHAGLAASEGEIGLVNSGAGQFSYTASVTSGSSWLSLTKTSGTCSDEEKIPFTIDRKGMGNDYYRAVVNIDCGSTGSTNVHITCGNGSIIYKEDFEEPNMVKGDLQMQDKWTVRDGNYCRNVNEANVVDFEGNSCMEVKRALGIDGIRNTYLSGCPENELIKFSMKIYWSDESEAQSVYLATPSGMKPFCMKIKKTGDGTFYLYQMLDGGYNPPLQGVTWPMNEWVPVSFTLDFRSQCGYEVQFGDDIGDISGLTLYGSGKYTKLEGYSFCTDGSGDEFDSKFYYDDFQMEVVERPNAPKMAVSDTKVVAGFDATSVNIGLSNLGEGSFDWTASLPQEPSWCEIRETSGTVTKEGTVTLNLIRKEMGNDYYKTFITIDAGDAGKTNVAVFACSGNVFYKETFEEPFMKIGDVEGQDGWMVRSGDGHNENNAACVTNGLPFTDNACLYCIRSWGYDGTTRDKIKNCPENSRVQVSMDVYWSGDSNCDAVYLASPYWIKPMTLKIENKGDGTFGVRGMQDDAYKVMVGKTWSMDEWVHIAYSMDFRTYTGYELTIGDVTESITQVPLRGNKGDHKKYQGFSYCLDGSEGMDARFYIDNLTCEVIPREDKPKPVFESAINLGEGDEATVTVLNYGTKYDYTASIIDLPSNLTVTPASGSVTDSGDLTVKVDRKGLDGNFYRARLLYAYTDGTNKGTVTNLVTFSVGGWYYGTDFLGPYFKLGPLNGQDCWTATSDQTEVISLAGENCIKFPYATRTDLYATVPLEGEFTFSARIYAEELEDDSYIHIGTVDGNGYYPIYFSREGNPRELQLGYFQGGNWTSIATGKFGEWNDFSFTMDTDTKVACIKSMTFGDFSTNFVEGDLPLNPDYDGKQITKFTIESHDKANPAGIYVARVSIHDPNVPEPAILGLLALLGLALARRR